MKPKNPKGMVPDTFPGWAKNELWTICPECSVGQPHARAIGSSVDGRKVFYEDGNGHIIESFKPHAQLISLLAKAGNATRSLKNQAGGESVEKIDSAIEEIASLLKYCDLSKLRHLRVMKEEELE